MLDEAQIQAEKQRWINRIKNKEFEKNLLSFIQEFIDSELPIVVKLDIAATRIDRKGNTFGFLLVGDNKISSNILVYRYLQWLADHAEDQEATPKILQLLQMQHEQGYTFGLLFAVSSNEETRAYLELVKRLQTKDNGEAIQQLLIMRNNTEKSRSGKIAEDNVVNCIASFHEVQTQYQLLSDFVLRAEDYTHFKQGKILEYILKIEPETEQLEVLKSVFAGPLTPLGQFFWNKENSLAGDVLLQIQDRIAEIENKEPAAGNPPQQSEGQEIAAAEVSIVVSTASNATYTASSSGNTNSNAKIVLPLNDAQCLAKKENWLNRIRKNLLNKFKKGLFLENWLLLINDFINDELPIDLKLAIAAHSFDLPIFNKTYQKYTVGHLLASRTFGSSKAILAYLQWLTKRSKVNKGIMQQIIALLKQQDSAGNTVGHLIAHNRGVAATRAYLLLVTELCTEENAQDILALLKLRDSAGNTLGHVIADNIDPATTKAWLALVKKLRTTKNAEEILKLLRQRDKTGNTVGHSIAHHKDPATTQVFLAFVKELRITENAEEILDLLLLQDNQGWNLGHVIARHQDDDTTQYYIYLLIELHTHKNTPKILQLLKQAITDNWNLGHIIARNRNAATTQAYLILIDELLTTDNAAEILALLTQRVTQYASLYYLILHIQDDVTEKSYLHLVERLVGMIAQNVNLELHYQAVAELSLSESQYKLFSKTEMLEHIVKTKPEAEQLHILKFIVENPASLLGKFFQYKENSTDEDCLPQIRDRIAELEKKQPNAENKTVSSKAQKAEPTSIATSSSSSSRPSNAATTRANTRSQANNTEKKINNDDDNDVLISINANTAAEDLIELQRPGEKKRWLRDYLPWLEKQPKNICREFLALKTKDGWSVALMIAVFKDVKTQFDSLSTFTFPAEDYEHFDKQEILNYIATLQGPKFRLRVLKCTQDSATTLGKFFQSHQALLPRIATLIQEAEKQIASLENRETQPTSVSSSSSSSSSTNRSNNNNAAPPLTETQCQAEKQRWIDRIQNKEFVNNPLVFITKFINCYLPMAVKLEIMAHKFDIDTCKKSTLGHLLASYEFGNTDATLAYLEWLTRKSIHHGEAGLIIPGLLMERDGKGRYLWDMSVYTQDSAEAKQCRGLLSALLPPSTADNNNPSPPLTETQCQTEKKRWLQRMASKQFVKDLQLSALNIVDEFINCELPVAIKLDILAKRCMLVEWRWRRLHDGPYSAEGTHNKSTFGHALASNREWPQAVHTYLQWLTQQAGKNKETDQKILKLLLLQDEQGWTLGHTITIFKDDAALSLHADLIEKLRTVETAPAIAKLQRLLQLIPPELWTVEHVIAYDVVKIQYQVISDFNLPAEAYAHFNKYKIAQYMLGLVSRAVKAGELTELKQVIEGVRDGTTPLAEFFRSQRFGRTGLAMKKVCDLISEIERKLRAAANETPQSTEQTAVTTAASTSASSVDDDNNAQPVTTVTAAVAQLTVIQRQAMKDTWLSEVLRIKDLKAKLEYIKNFIERDELPVIVKLEIMAQCPTTDGNYPIGHWLAGRLEQKEDADPVVRVYLTWLTCQAEIGDKEVKQKILELLLQQDHYGCSVGHYLKDDITRQAHTDLIAKLETKENAPAIAKLKRLLKQTPPCSLRPGSLVKKIAETRGVENQYQLLSDFPLSIEHYKLFGFDKDKIYQHIVELFKKAKTIDELTELLAVLEGILDCQTNLGEFFWHSRGSTFTSLESGTLQKICNLIAEVKNMLPATENNAEEQRKRKVNFWLHRIRNKGFAKDPQAFIKELIDDETLTKEMKLEVLSQDTLVHLLASKEFGNTDAVFELLDFLSSVLAEDRSHAQKVLELLMIQDTYRWGTLGHMIARQAYLRSTENGFGFRQMIARRRGAAMTQAYLRLLKELCTTENAFDIQQLLKLQNGDGWTLGQAIARNQDEETSYQLLSTFILPAEHYPYFDKAKIVNYILWLSADKQLEALRKADDPKQPLGQFFLYKGNSTEENYLLKIRARIVKLSGEPGIAENNVQQNRSHKPTAPVTSMSSSSSSSSSRTADLATNVVSVNPSDTIDDMESARTAAGNSLGYCNQDKTADIGTELISFSFLSSSNTMNTLTTANATTTSVTVNPNNKPTTNAERIENNDDDNGVIPNLVDDDDANPVNDNSIVELKAGALAKGLAYSGFLNSRSRIAGNSRTKLDSSETSEDKGIELKTIKSLAPAV